MRIYISTRKQLYQNEIKTLPCIPDECYFKSGRILILILAEFQLNSGGDLFFGQRF